MRTDSAKKTAKHTRTKAKAGVEGVTPRMSHRLKTNPEVWGWMLVLAGRVFKPDL